MSFSAGDVLVHSFSLSGGDVRSKVSEFSVFEDMQKPYSSMTATIIDNTDLLNQVFSSGDNIELDLSFSQPGQEPYRGQFAITSVEKTRSTGSLRTTIYGISGYSRHMVKQPRVQKAYRELPATGIVQDLISSFLSPDKPTIVRAASKGVLGNDHMPYNVNGVMIHKAIRNVLDRAVSAVDSSSAYLMFENNKNMVVDTLENMLSNMSASITYIQRPMGQDFLRDSALQNRVILSFREESRMDRSDQVLSDNQQVNPFDVFSHANTGRVVGDKSQVSTIMNIVYNAMRPASMLSTTLPERKRVASNVDNQAITIHVPLNPGLTVGSGFGIDLIAPLGDTNTQKRDSLSGTLLATEVRHSVNLSMERMQGTTTARGVRGVPF